MTPRAIRGIGLAVGMALNGPGMAQARICGHDVTQTTVMTANLTWGTTDGLTWHAGVVLDGNHSTTERSAGMPKTTPHPRISHQKRMDRSHQEPLTCLRCDQAFISINRRTNRLCKACVALNAEGSSEVKPYPLALPSLNQRRRGEIP